MVNQETWRPVVGFEGWYEVSDHGRVRSLDRRIHCADGRNRCFKGQQLNPDLRNGYPYVTLGRRVKKYVHHLVLEAFVGHCPEGKECLHDDGDGSNAKLNNLRWGTKLENEADKVRHFTVASGERNGHAKLDVEKVKAIRSFEGVLHRELADKFSVSRRAIGHILAGTTWKECA